MKVMHMQIMLQSKKVSVAPINKMKGEISFDLVIPDAGIDHIEGSYRIDGDDWKIFYFTHWHDGKQWDGDPIITVDAVWQSGITGVNGVYSISTLLNKKTSMMLLSDALGGVTWSEVRGPDSLELK